jgi:hypothetical protein
MDPATAPTALGVPDRASARSVVTATSNPLNTNATVSTRLTMTPHSLPPRRNRRVDLTLRPDALR